ncbi:AbrB family transcriptional regulator [Rhizobium sp. C4]|uniref:AbrB family transcriptional regulator n=1 Tax=Rhizobium sp. C4 TaxID=1349800 RepID=UPI001E41739C|nr:AbrB family transcriptional regulator [Rhizobium sp. C4]MCD2173291.1 AbrB family transcriptional regulator [Rhizobium sp. C4]
MSKSDSRNSIRNWCLLIVLTAVVTGVLYAMHLPAVFLLGPMVSGLLLASRGMKFSLPSPLVAFCQGIIGVMIAGGMPLTVFAEIAKDGFLFIGLVLSVVALSFGFGWLLAKYQVLPGTTAIWGSSPGAASAMVLMAEAAGADFRLVAFMQYLRMLMVAATASLIARFVLGQTGQLPVPEPWFPPVDPLNLVLTLAIAACGPVFSRLFKRPSINMLAPIVIGIACHAAGLVTITLPHWLLASAYLLFGWNVGFRFTREIVTHALRALPVLFLSILSLIVLCGLLAVAVSHFGHMDLLTAYLATSPGGADSVAIIAASTPVDKPFVLAMQMTRFISVLFLGPVLSRYFAARFDRRLNL